MFGKLAAVFALAALGTPAFAQDATTAGTCSTIITSLPYTITAPGHYCLRSNAVVQSHYGIHIASSDVVLNCRGRSIQAATQSPGSDGIAGMSGLQNVTVQNCIVRNFDRGISAGHEGSNTQILNNRVENVLSDGIMVWGHNARVVNNRVSNILPSAAYQVVGISLMPYSPAISATGQEAINNTVAGLTADYLLVGLMISGSTNPRLVNNHVMDLRRRTDTHAIAIWLSGWAQGANTTGGQLINNALMMREPGVSGLSGQPALCKGNTSVGIEVSGFESCLTQTDNTTIQ
ncbi:right-handed parallel beta-helix repeat-containing protein [Pseudoxanthomonas sp. PXM01]|uniref:right-handed parallel beta-helix repeat-containing protein n=1 Tax=Pseudoxanthomonas sp. PXM01 TaxID=2769295 RepID=UPI00178226E6|nr:right-handed parallel beta-helix repeat-containing protein [Pseudoxanthomonas sp. PXM01]MBD9467691.1 right-handed parallel beta-helix repeat-containing protein [Pseudoxanthomonas sp. PXM01]